MKLVNSDFMPDADQQVVCPFCDYDYIHPVNVKVYPVNGTTECEITSDGISIRDSNAAKSQRGVSIVLRFTCESGHVWDSELLFYKGYTLVKTRLVHEMTAEEFEEGKFPNTLWRD